jgi:hypothetical protein
LPKKEGMPHFLEPFNESQQKLSKNIWQTPLLWQLKKFSHYPKNSNGRMAIEIF